MAADREADRSQSMLNRPVPSRAAPSRLALGGGTGGGPRTDGWTGLARPGLAGAGLADAGQLTEADRMLMAAWATDAGLLLAEREERRAETAGAVWLPPRLSVSSLVMMARDPAELAQQIRRPMPRPPAPQARRGTAFHRWLEERFSQQRLIDPDDLLGAADDPDGGRPTATVTTWLNCASGSRRGSGATGGRPRWRSRSRR